MFLKQTKQKSGRIFLQIVRKYRQDGKIKESVVLSIGFLDDVSSAIVDPISHYKQLAFDMTTKEKNLNPPVTLEFSINQRLSYTNNLKNLGYVYLQSEYYSLGLKDFFKSKQDTLDIHYNMNNVCRLLTFSRILFPSSKKATFDNASVFFENIAPTTIDPIYDFLSRIASWKDELQALLHKNIKELYGRDDQVSYFDCTNYYFEMDEENEICKKGPSKEHRKSPIVQMGLLMDTNGIPMAYHIFPGNESEKVNMLPVLKRCKREYQLQRIVVVADKGLNTSDNIFYTHGKKDGYIYSQTIRGSDKNFKEWALDPTDFKSHGKHKDTLSDEKGTVIDSFKIKSRIIGKTITIKDEKENRTHEVTIKQKQIVYYSPKYAKRCKKLREVAIEKAKNLVENKGTYTSATNYGALNYIKETIVTEETGEVHKKKIMRKETSKGNIHLAIDIHKIQEEEKYDGYYSIVTSEIGEEDLEIIKIYRGLWKIEESFKITKSEFKTRPVYLKNKERIESHFFICFLALVLVRIMEYRSHREYSPHQIIKSLRKDMCVNVGENFYQMIYRDEVTETLDEIYGIDTGYKYRTLQQIKKLLAEAKKREYTTTKAKMKKR